MDVIMRLTKKDVGMVATCEASEETIEKVAIYNKLYELEDIEEQIGVELLILFKALENGAYCKRGKKTVFFYRLEASDLVNYSFKVFNTKKWEWETYNFKDYGKTWALTKEELTNEKED